MNSTTSRLVVLLVLALAFVAAVLAQSSSFYEDDSFSLSSADNDEDLPAMPLGFDEAEQQDFSESDNNIDAQDLFENIEDSVAPQAFDEQVEDESSEDAAASLALRSSGSRSSSSRSSSSRSSSSRSSGLRSSSSSSRSSSGLRSSSSSSRSSSGLRSSSSSSRSSSGLRSSSSRSSSGLRSSSSRSSSSRSTYRSSSRSRSSTTKVKIVSYKKVKITYPKLKVKYSVIFRNPRPSVYLYRGTSYNTYTKYTLMGEYTLEEILRIIGSAPYVRRTMKIRYMTSTLGYKYLWRNVVIDLTNGNTFIIRASTPAGSTVITTPIIGGLNITTPASTTPASNSTTAVTGTSNAAQTLEYYMEDATEDASVLQATSTTTTTTSAEANLTPSSTTVIEPTPTGATPDTNDVDSQNDLKAADAITQDQLSVMQVPVYAGAPKSTIISVAAVVIMAAAWLFAL